MSKKSFIEQLQQEVDGIRKELGCTEAEAYFTIRRIARRMQDGDEYQSRYPIAIPPSPEEGYRNAREWAVASTKGLMEILQAYREATERGVWKYNFIAVELCGRLAFPVPDWIDKKFYYVLEDYNRSRVVTLDEAFGAKRPKHYRQDKEREISEKSFDIYMRCRQLQEEGVKIAAPEYGGGVFQVVGDEDEYHMSASKVRDYYYMHHKTFSDSIVVPASPPSERDKGSK